MADQVTSDTGPFTIVPEWVLTCGLSSRAIHLYAVLGRYADRDGLAFPSRRTLAHRLDVSVDTVDRTIRELAEAGAVSVTHRRDDAGDMTSNSYVVHRLCRGGRTHAATGGRTHAAQNENQDEREPPLPPADNSEEAPPDPGVEGIPQAVWDEFAAVALRLEDNVTAPAKWRAKVAARAAADPRLQGRAKLWRTRFDFSDVELAGMLVSFDRGELIAPTRFAGRQR